MHESAAHDAVDAAFEEHRPLMFGIAYRMLGSAMEAEDVVQDAWLRWRTAERATIDSPKAYLTTIVTRLCLDQLKSARVQRETYIGPWLPEPVATGANAAPLAAPTAELGSYESISMAFLVILESLSPVERAVFLLREVFEYDYAEIARIVKHEEAACRQSFSRARKHIAARRPRYAPSPQDHRKVVDRFLAAVEAGDVGGLVEVMAEDVVWWSDGGGKVSAARHPIHGRDHVLRLLVGLARLRPSGTTHKLVEVNGRSALVIYVDGAIYAVFNFDTDGERIRAVHAVVNPDKLAHVAA